MTLLSAKDIAAVTGGIVIGNENTVIQSVANLFEWSLSGYSQDLTLQDRGNFPDYFHNECDN